MTAARRRFLICLALALAAHAALFATMAGHPPVPRDTAKRTLHVTFSSQTTAADGATPVLAAHAQRGADAESRPAPAATTRQYAAAGSNPVTDTTLAHVQRRAADASQRPSAAHQTQPRQARQKPRHAPEQQNAQTARTRSARADPRAAYLATWRQRVEHYGNQHYPSALIAAAARKRLTLGVTLRADGHLHSVRILASSGSRELDRAAMAIVRNAAPYPALPEPLQLHNRRLTFAYDWLFDDAAGD